MITPQQFKQRWERISRDHLIVFTESSLSDVRLPADARAFLTEAGLPEEAAPFLYFELPKKGTLARVSHIYHQLPAFDRYRIIGGNGSGDPVCIDEETDGQIVYLNHDNRFQRVLMATSVFTLAECLTQLRDVIADAGSDADLVTPDCFGQLLERLRAIDSVAFDFWRPEVESLSQ